MATLSINYRLPLPGLPQARFESNYSLNGGQLIVAGSSIVSITTREALQRGVEVEYPEGRRLTLSLREGVTEPDVAIAIDDQPAIREDRARVPATRSAWIHGVLALAASFFGFASSYLYFLRSQAGADDWALKMAIHMAAWHLLLTIALLPASVWGGRTGIRGVQATSVLFFLIHLGAAFANVDDPANGLAISVLNAASGILFLASAFYGQLAHSEMDPFRAFREA
jgi:hypothetical protein